MCECETIRNWLIGYLTFISNLKTTDWLTGYLVKVHSTAQLNVCMYSIVQFNLIKFYTCMSVHVSVCMFTIHKA